MGKVQPLLAYSSVVYETKKKKSEMEAPKASDGSMMVPSVVRFRTV